MSIRCFDSDERRSSLALGRWSSGVEHFLGQEEVDSSILFNGSIQLQPGQAGGQPNMPHS